MSTSGWIGVDLDGTLAKYAGWVGPDHIGEPVALMLRRVKKWIEQGVDVRIFTARVSVDPDGSIASLIGDWTEKHVGKRGSGSV